MNDWTSIWMLPGDGEARTEPAMEARSRMAMGCFVLCGPRYVPHYTAWGILGHWALGGEHFPAANMFIVHVALLHIIFWCRFSCAQGVKQIFRKPTVKVGSSWCDKKGLIDWRSLKRCKALSLWERQSHIYLNGTQLENYRWFAQSPTPTITDFDIKLKITDYSLF